MKERPILFSAPMVRALLAGTKSQTRRVVKPQPEAEHGGEPYWFVGGYRAWPYRRTDDVLRQGGNVLPCPYGQPGTRLWVREAFIHEPADYCWEASVSIPCRPATTIYRAAVDDPRGGRWTPSIHMPRNLSRITLEVTGVRVERVAAISESDAIAEGIEPVAAGYWRLYGRDANGDMDRSPRVAYRSLWEQINRPGSWDANPWVWVLEFKRVGDAA